MGLQQEHFELLTAMPSTKAPRYFMNSDLAIALFLYHVLDKYFSIQKQKEHKKLFCVFLKIRYSLIITIFLSML